MPSRKPSTKPEEAKMTDDSLKEKNAVQNGGAHQHEFELIVNKQPHKWPNQFVAGADIKRLAGSLPDWVVNQIVPGPGEDPEIADNQKVDLDPKSPPPGVK